MKHKTVRETLLVLLTLPKDSSVLHHPLLLKLYRKRLFTILNKLQSHTEAKEMSYYFKRSTINDDGFNIIVQSQYSNVHQSFLKGKLNLQTKKYVN